MHKKIFITGGTGFIGSRLAEVVKAEGATEVRCLVRNQLKWLDGQDIIPIRGDLFDEAALEAGCRDVDAVYHVAGVTRAQDPQDLIKGNVTATLNLLNTVKRVAPAVQRVLVTSSQAAVGPSGEMPSTEADPFQPISAYGESKAEMERQLAPYFDQLPMTVVRPPAVYGPRERDIYTFFQTVNKGLCPIVGSGREPQLNLVYVEDLVRGMIQAAQSANTMGETYFLGSAKDYSWHEIRDAICTALDQKALTVHLPTALVGPLGTIVEGIGGLFGTYPPFNREKAREAKATWRCAITKAHNDFGYTPNTPLATGMTQTAAWYRAKGWL